MAPRPPAAPAGSWRQRVGSGQDLEPYVQVETRPSCTSERPAGAWRKDLCSYDMFFKYYTFSFLTFW